jgi:cytochrome c556
MIIRTVLAVAAIAIGVTAVAAQQDPIAARKALMKGNGQQSGVVTKMLRGEEPFDAAKVDAAFSQYAETAQKLPGLFPENSKTGETRALPKIWENRGEFDAAIAKFAKDVADNREKVKTLEGLKANYPAVGRNCGGCHETFRRPQT